MEDDSTTAQATTLFTGEAWFDPIEVGIRERIRGFIEALFEEELTAALGRAINLTHLDLRGNKLRALPSSLAALPQLEKLDLRWNKLTGEQPWIEELERRGCVALR